MPKQLRVLIVEDSEDDALLTVRELRRAYDLIYRQVDTPDAMRAALTEETWDVIISDYIMPRFDGLAALRIAREKNADVPFILTSGTVNTATGMEALRSGAADFIEKDQRARLAPVIERELARKASRREPSSRPTAALQTASPAPPPIRAAPASRWSKWILPLGGVALILFAFIWRWQIAVQWTQRIPENWVWESNFIGAQTYADEKTNRFPEKDAQGFYVRTLQVVERKGEAVTMEDRYVIRDPKTNEKTWEYVYRAQVDARTGAHLDPMYRGDYFVFPREAQPTTYRLRFNYIKGVPLTFQREEDIEGINTYLFAYKGRGEYTESYAGSADYPGVVVAQGQEIKCADDQFVLRLWVEPITGEILNLEESCYSGDYIFDIASGKPVIAVLRWGGATSGDDILKRAQIIRAQRDNYLWLMRYVPRASFIAGVGLVGLWLFGLWRQKRRQAA